MEKKQTPENEQIGKGRAGPGRPKGVPNRTTTLLKDAILKAAEMAGGEGGTEGYLARMAEEQPAAFMTLMGKVLPMQVNHGDAEGNKIVFTIRDMTKG